MTEKQDENGRGSSSSSGDNTPPRHQETCENCRHYHNVIYRKGSEKREFTDCSWCSCKKFKAKNHRELEVREIRPKSGGVGIYEKEGTSNLSGKIELWKLKFGIAVSQSPKFKELDNLLKEAVRLLKENLEKAWEECDWVDCDGSLHGEFEIIDAIFGSKLI